jgi:hypothetical protein
MQFVCLTANPKVDVNEMGFMSVIQYEQGIVEQTSEIAESSNLSREDEDNGHRMPNHTPSSRGFTGLDHLTLDIQHSTIQHSISSPPHLHLHRHLHPHRHLHA